MLSLTAGPGRARRALVVIPGSVNYFYNLNGRRLAEGLRELGFDTDLCPLGDCPEGEYDWCALVNLSEVFHSVGDYAAAAARVRELGRRCRAMACCALDCVATPWYQALLDN